MPHKWFGLLDSKHFVVWRSSEKPAFVLVDTIGKLQEFTSIKALDIAWIDAENLLLFNGVEFWVIDDNHHETLVLRIEEGHIPLQYYRQFDFR